MPRISLRSDTLRRHGLTIPPGTPFEVTDRELAGLRAAYERRPTEIVLHAERTQTTPTPRKRSDESRSGRTIIRKPLDPPSEKGSDETGNGPTGNGLTSDSPTDDAPTDAPDSAD